MFPRSKNIKDGWQDSLTEIEREFDEARTLKEYAERKQREMLYGIDPDEIVDQYKYM
jgi:hypothetical protein